ncbi:SEC-C domain-containing protein [Actinokineospora sp. UTMC 2448]|uniref:SEC-C domain-containing protein n=1 Tax=Actinokineospora sp. UTMC 2448 TaxID=2268449 RepID=UPI0021647BCC|nr:SEC-C domain-containing protein [Actinokineospora sp. UTMC 2448]UVS76414.1 SEC-C motif [Actinokineospora sp. UTMC 2448]
MSRRSAVKNTRKVKDSDSSGVNPRQPCPCGSGKRYKACHGSSGGVVDVPVARPFDGLAFECELVALREFVPSGTARLALKDDREVTLATVLPMAAAALVRADGVAFLGLQVQTRSNDISRDLARALTWLLEAKAGDVLPVVGPESDPGPDPERLQDLVDTAAELPVEVHADFGWWLPEGSEPSGDVALSLERANQAIMPTERIGPAAYWVDAGEKAHLRWVRPEPEERLLAAMARLHARGELSLGEGSRYAGSFRAHGLLVPVWDLDPEQHAREWTAPAAELGARVDAALASLDDEPLTGTERRARDGLLGRQITIR